MSQANKSAKSPQAAKVNKSAEERSPVEVPRGDELRDAVALLRVAPLLTESAKRAVIGRAFELAEASVESAAKAARSEKDPEKKISILEGLLTEQAKLNMIRSQVDAERFEEAAKTLSLAL